LSTCGKKDVVVPRPPIIPNHFESILFFNNFFLFV
jgi:hypothetical protein